MSLLTIFSIATGLSMDAFSVSVTNGLGMKKFDIKKAFIISFFYGFFQFIMPVIGFYAAGIFKGYIEAVDHWVAFILLLLIGIKMITESFEEKEESSDLSIKVLFLQAIATSIDALAVGISFVALNFPVFKASFIIGITTFILSFIGVLTGKKAGNIFKGKAEILGGVILIGIGIKILVEHLFFN